MGNWTYPGTSIEPTKSITARLAGIGFPSRLDVCSELTLIESTKSITLRSRCLLRSNFGNLISAENTCIRVPPVERDWEFTTVVPPTTPRPRREVTQTTAYFTTPRPNLTNGSNQTKTTNPAQTTTTPPPELIFTTPIPCPATDLKRGKELEKDNVHPYRYEEEAFHDLPLVSRKCPSPGMCMPCPMAPDLDLTIDQVRLS